MGIESKNEDGQGLSGSCLFWIFKRRAEWVAERAYYRDKYNRNKVWEVVKLNGGYYLRQYVCGRQAGRGLRTTKKFIRSLGVFDFEVVIGFKGSCRDKRKGHQGCL